MENAEIEKPFFLDYVDNYLHVADQRSELNHSTWKKS